MAGMHRVARGLAASLALALLAAACSGGDPDSRAEPTTTVSSTTLMPTTTAAPSTTAGAQAASSAQFRAAKVRLVRVARLEQPVAMAVRPGERTLYLVEQAGRVRAIRGGRLDPTPVLDISEQVTAGGEQGLLGLSFSPDGRYLYLHYTDRSGDHQVSELTMDGRRADPGSQRSVLRIDDPFGNHNGGQLAFGPDRRLYLAFGDGGGGGDPEGNGQSLDSLLGKILRIDVDGTTVDGRYSIPADNPFAARQGGVPEILHVGLRNPWRMSFDRQTGDLWIGDVGQGSSEEVDVARAGSGSLNFGWNRVEGFECFEPPDCDPTRYTAPVTAYGHDLGCSVIGGAVYRGTSQPLLAGGYVYSDYCGGNFWVLDPTQDGPLDGTLVAEPGRQISAIGEDEAGELYATDLGSGELLHIVATER
jgi:glucose/arabinose dehydrogenase